MAELRVAVIFEDGKGRPVWIDRRGKRIDITEILDYWERHIGNELIRHYVVTDGHNNYELLFNSDTVRWTCSYIGPSK